MIKIDATYQSDFQPCSFKIETFTTGSEFLPFLGRHYGSNSKENSFLITFAEIAVVSVLEC